MKLIFDIGYNKGEFTAECFKQHGGVKVIGVEANPNLCIGIKNTENFILLNKLVSDEANQYIDFYIEPRQHGISTASKQFMKESRFVKGSKNLKKNSAQWNKPIPIQSITIDDMIREYGVPDLIKIDVEGYELNVIKGLSQKVNEICFEWHEEDYNSLLLIVKHLETIGYNKFGVIGWFDEGDVFPKVTFSSKGDPYLSFPKEYYNWSELEMNRLIKSERRINYGMFYAK